MARRGERCTPARICKPIGHTEGPILTRAWDHRHGTAGWLLIITIVGSLALQGISLLIAGQASVIVVFLVLMPPYLIAAVLLIVSGRDTSPAAAASSA